jgi:hypothetical protein
MEVYNAKPSQATGPATMLAVDQARTDGGAELITPSITSPFDYAALGAESRIVVRQKTGEIRERVKRAAEDIVAIGERLLMVKDHLGHGRFGQWLAAEFQMNERSAQRMMAVAERFKTDNVSDLNITPSALYLLASNAVPDDVRRHAIASAKAGAPVTHKAVQARVAAQRPMPGPAVAVMVKPVVNAFPPPAAPVGLVAVPDVQIPDGDYGQVRHSKATAAKRLTEGETLPLLPKSEPAELSGRALAEHLNATDPLLIERDKITAPGTDAPADRGGDDVHWALDRMAKLLAENSPSLLKIREEFKAVRASVEADPRPNVPAPATGKDDVVVLLLNKAARKSADRIIAAKLGRPFLARLTSRLHDYLIRETYAPDVVAAFERVQRLADRPRYMISQTDLAAAVANLKDSLAMGRLPQSGGGR